MNGPVEYRQSKRSRTNEFGRVCEKENFSAENTPPVGESLSVRGLGTLLLDEFADELGELGKEMVRYVEVPEPDGHSVMSALREAI